ncbi:MAG: flagellar biosynthetic protein FliR [Myxococcota bacterium]
MEELLTRLGVGQTTLTVGALVAARIAPLTVFAPWLTLRRTPPIIRGSLIVALTVALTPLALTSAGSAVDSVGPLVFGAMALREALVGTLFAVATALPLYALDWSGRLVDTWRGASLAEVIAPPTGERTSPLGDLYLMMGVVLFLTLGGHRVAFAAFADALVVAPVGDVNLVGGAGTVAFGAARLSASALAFATSVAAPMAVAIVVVEMSLGLIARSAPQVPVFFAGMPLRAATGLGAALAGLSLLVGQLPEVFSTAIEIARDWVSGIQP